MKIIHKPEPAPQPIAPRWKLLVVDDEEDVRAITRMTLRGMRFAEREIELLEANSAASAFAQLQAHPDIAVALIDVVMETEDAGLQLVRRIREELGNRLIRLVIRTGQPGAAPERYVIDHFDIDDYKDKTELTTTRLYTTVRSALKAWRELCVIDMNRRGLERLLTAAPEIYSLHHLSLHQFFSAVLTQIISLCDLSPLSYISTVEGVLASCVPEDAAAHASTTGFADESEFHRIHGLCCSALSTGEAPAALPPNALVLPLLIHDEVAGYLFIAPRQPLSEDDLRLVRLAAQQCAQALENQRLHGDLARRFEATLETLGEVSEFKDRCTGGHIARIAEYTRTVALELGCSPVMAEQFARAARLHDVGKVGIADNILCKPGKLSTEEMRAMQGHTRIGASILGHDPAFSLAQSIALHHHERWDGEGYPDRLPAATLPLAVRIVSVVDVFDALISPRPYKPGWPVAQARAAVLEGSGTQFDPQVVDAFIRLLDGGAFASLLICETEPSPAEA